MIPWRLNYLNARSRLTSNRYRYRVLDARLERKLAVVGSPLGLPSCTSAIGAMAASRAVWLSTAIKAAVQARAPRRTVAAVAASVTTALMQMETGRASAASRDAGPPPATAETGDGNCEDLVRQLREARAMKRREKRQRRRARAQAKTATAPTDSAIPVLGFLKGSGMMAQS